MRSASQLGRWNADDAGRLGACSPVRIAGATRGDGSHTLSLQSIDKAISDSSRPAFWEIPLVSSSLGTALTERLLPTTRAHGLSLRFHPMSRDNHKALLTPSRAILRLGFLQMARGRAEI